MQPSLRINSILRQVIRHGFPDLARKTIVLSIGEYADWMFYEPAGQSRGSFIIGVDVSLLGASRRVIAGGLAHELAHIVRDSRMRRWQRDRAYSLYFTSPAFRTRDERETDREAIARGYGRELLELMLFGRARGGLWGREDGLTLPEVHRMERHGGVRSLHRTYRRNSHQTRKRAITATTT
jgi:hypothetical protein